MMSGRAPRLFVFSDWRAIVRPAAKRGHPDAGWRRLSARYCCRPWPCSSVTRRQTQSALCNANTGAPLANRTSANNPPLMAVSALTAQQATQLVSPSAFRKCPSLRRRSPASPGWEPVCRETTHVKPVRLDQQARFSRLGTGHHLRVRPHRAATDFPPAVPRVNLMAEKSGVSRMGSALVLLRQHD